MDGEITEAELQQIRETNTLSLKKMWQAAIEKLTFRKSNEYETLNLAAKSSEEKIVLADGSSLLVVMSITGRIGGTGVVPAFSIELNRASDKKEIAWRSYLAKVISGKATFKSNIAVDPRYDKVGIGSSLINLDEEIETIMVEKINSEFHLMITEIAQQYLDATDTQNPRWTTRRFQNDPRFRQLTKDTWMRTIQLGKKNETTANIE